MAKLDFHLYHLLEIETLISIGTDAKLFKGSLILFKKKYLKSWDFEPDKELSLGQPYKCVEINLC